MPPAGAFRPLCTILSDSPVEAALIESLLVDDFDDVTIRLASRETAKGPGAGRPVVLLLAFKDLAKSEHHYLSMYRNRDPDTLQPHRTVLLCTKEDASSAYRLCHRGLFDDYVVFWPITHDPKRLLMAVHQLSDQLRREIGERPTAVQFAAQARCLGKLEEILSAQLRRGQNHIASTGRAVEQAETEMTTALRALPSALVLDGAPPDGEAVGNIEEVLAPHWRSISETLAPLSEWADNVMQAMSPQLQSVRELGAMADRMPSAVMVVDDDEFQRRLVGSILESEGYEVVFAASGREALGALRKSIPALILLDYKMPDMDGVSVIRELKSDPRFAGVPIIMLTGNVERSLVVNSLELGAADFIVKPYNRGTITGKVAQVMNKDRTARRQIR